MQTVEVDFMRPEVLRNPHPSLALLRESAPIYHIQHQEITGQIWLLTRYEDAIAHLNDDRFTKNPERLGDIRGEQNEMMSAAGAINRHILTLDPPDHTRLRVLIHKAFTPKMIRDFETQIQQIADSLIDQMLEKEEGDFIRDFAFPLPIAVIASILGIPLADRDKFRRWSQAVIFGSRPGADIEQIGAAVIEFIMYFVEKFEERRAAPTDDLITALVQAEEAGDKLDPQELISMVFLLLVAGHETTVNLLGNGLLALLQNPDQKALLSQHPELTKTAVEEFLRYDGSLGISSNRWALEDVEYYGQVIPAGSSVAASLLSANRDPAMFENPDTLDITRPVNKHIAFGNGIHYCVGAPLARLEAAVAFPTLLRRLPNLALAVDVDELEWQPTILLHGMKAMPVTVK